MWKVITADGKMIEDRRTVNTHEQKLRHLAWDLFVE
jgi:hypothetical protein